MTEGADFHRVPNVWVKNEPTGHANYAVLDESGVRVIDREVFYAVSGELLEKMMYALGFKPVEEER
jgi:hypothetical protein